MVVRAVVQVVQEQADQYAHQALQDKVMLEVLLLLTIKAMVVAAVLVLLAVMVQAVLAALVVLEQTLIRPGQVQQAQVHQVITQVAVVEKQTALVVRAAVAQVMALRVLLTQAVVAVLAVAQAALVVVV
jgi:hypothetical protein